MRERDAPEEIRALLVSLGISADLIESRSLVLHPEAGDLVLVETDERGRRHFLAQPAADAWRVMKGAAAADGIVLRIVSAFRSIERQA